MFIIEKGFVRLTELAGFAGEVEGGASGGRSPENRAPVPHQPSSADCFSFSTGCLVHCCFWSPIGPSESNVKSQDSHRTLKDEKAILKLLVASFKGSTPTWSRLGIILELSGAFWEPHFQHLCEALGIARPICSIINETPSPPTHRSSSRPGWQATSRSVRSWATTRTRPKSRRKMRARLTGSLYDAFL